MSRMHMPKVILNDYVLVTDPDCEKAGQWGIVGDIIHPRPWTNERVTMYRVSFRGNTALLLSRHKFKVIR